MEILSIILTGLSLIATIIGWSITYKYQKRLLETQLSADFRKTKMQFSIPQKLEYLKKIKDWHVGMKELCNLVYTRDRDFIVKNLYSWESKFELEILSAAQYLDAFENSIDKEWGGNHLLYLVGVYNHLCKSEILYVVYKDEEYKQHLLDEENEGITIKNELSEALLKIERDIIEDH